MSKIRKKFVVDTSVARAASSTVNKQVNSGSNARTLLKYVMDNKIKLVFTDELYKEWKEHASNFAKSVQVQLVSRGRIIKISTANKVKTSLISTLGDISDPNIRNQIKKDLHLLEGALYPGCFIVISNDRKIVRHFKINFQILNIYDNLGEIKWFHPDDNNLLFQYARNNCSIRQGYYSIEPCLRVAQLSKPVFLNCPISVISI